MWKYYAKWISLLEHSRIIADKITRIQALREVHFAQESMLQNYTPQSYTFALNCPFSFGSTSFGRWSSPVLGPYQRLRLKMSKDLIYLRKSLPRGKNIRSNKRSGIHTTNGQKREEESNAEPQHYIEDHGIVLRISLGATGNLRLKQKTWCNGQADSLKPITNRQSCGYPAVSSKFANDTLYVSWHFANR